MVPDDLRRDVRRILESYSAVQDLAIDPDRHDEANRSSGERPLHSTPTENKALAGDRDPARRWLRKLEHVGREVLGLANEAKEMLGEPVLACARCHRVIEKEQRQHKAEGRDWHHTCYVAHRREIKRQENR